MAFAPDPLSLPGCEPGETLQIALDAIPYGVLIFDASRRPVFMNAAARASAGIPAGTTGNLPEHLDNVFRLFDPATERFVAADKDPPSRALRGETVDVAEYMVRGTGGGAAKWLECGARPTRGPGGGITGAVFTFRDISERKKQRFAVEAANRMSRFIYDENLAGIVRTTVDGRIVDCNDALIRMWGYASKQELLAVRAPRLYFDPGERDRLLRLVAVTGRLNEHEVCFRRKDGSRCWGLVNLRLMDAPGDEVGGTIVAAVVDITGRKLSEETLRQSEQRFAAFMRHLPGVAFIKDLNGKYVYYNEACWTQFRMRPEEIIGKTDEEVWPTDNAERYRQNDATVVRSKRPLEFVEPVAHPEGPHTWLIYKFPIIEGGEVILVGGVGIDITERTILQEQLNQARKMEALGRLAGGVAHDFNNLLTVIAGYGQLAIEGAGNTEPQKMIGYLQEILDSARRAAGLTNQLLAFGRRQVVEPRVFDLGDLLRNMERLLQRVIGEHVDLTVRSGHEPCLIRADTHQIEQVVMNLSVNARDAMPLGGTLDLRCERLAQPPASAASEPGEEEPPAILLEVRDTGIGMDEKIQKQIFDPFFTSKESGKGTGLGLSTVYGIVSQAKGRIEVKSEPGEGTVFRVYFPEARAEAETAAPPVKASGKPSGKETILLVEDEAAVRALAETILTQLGYRVLVADSGQSAIGIWEESRGRIDALLTDVIMPHMSGGDLAHRLRDINPRLKVLFMSGYTDDMIASHGVLAGETQLLQKPFSAETLARKLRDVLDA
jgi:two-component system, cell cycle sensor histidine kinase and response regulator CckA